MPAVCHVTVTKRSLSPATVVVVLVYGRSETTGHRRLDSEFKLLTDFNHLGFAALLYSTVSYSKMSLVLVTTTPISRTMKSSFSIVHYNGCDPRSTGTIL